MNIIVFDLEWNQSGDGHEPEVSVLPFEIIEIGAVKLNDRFEEVDRFSRLIHPQVYTKMHRVTEAMLHLSMEDLADADPFTKVAQDFIAFCGEQKYRFAVWGGTDLIELQRNLKFFGLPDLAQGPFPYYNVQKLYSLAMGEGKNQRALDYAVQQMEIRTGQPFHRAFSDAYYTAEVFRKIQEKNPEVMQYLSYDIFHPPIDRKHEIKARFDTYTKYISRVFEDKAEAFEDKEVSSSKCYLCCRNLRKKIRWFSVNTKHYYCLACCEKHGYLKGKIRIKKVENGIFVVKTTKLISREEAEKIAEKKAKSI